MTKIPSVEIVEATKAKITETLTEYDYISDWVNTGIDLIVESLQAERTAEREAGAREFVSELRKVLMGDDGEDSYIALSARIALFIRKHEALTPPTK